MNVELSTEKVNTNNRLINVILINSYPKQQIHKLNVDNNTIITGRNASGKTTLMGAIAPFYGVLLSNIARKSDVKKSFLEFYLPTDKSYLIYEYLKDDKVFSVLLRNAHSSPVFHFINTPYHSDDFITPQQNGIYFNDFNQIKSNIKQRGAEISDNLSQTEYEAIISNCSNSILKEYHPDAQKTIRKYRSDFALVSSNKGSFLGFAPIAHNVLQSKLEFNDICKFLVEAMQKQGILQNDTIKLNTQGINTQLWVAQRQTWQKIEALKPKFAELSQLLATNQHGQQQLYRTLQSARVMKIQLDEQLTILIEQKNEQEKVLADEKRQLIDREIEFNKQHRLWQNQIDDISQKIKNLDKQKLAFEQGDRGFAPIATLQNWLKERPIWLNDRKQKRINQQFLQQQLQKLATEINEIEQNFERQIAQLNESLSKNQAILTTQRQAFTDNNQEQRDKLRTEFDQQKESLENHYADQLIKLENLKKDVELQQREINTHLANTGVSQFYNEQIEQNIIKQSQIDNYLAQQKQQVKDKQTALATILEVINQKLVEKTTLTAEINQLDVEKQQLLALSQDDTLYSFLLQSEQDFPSLIRPIENIYKTIHPDLLRRNDLNPDWQTHKEPISTLYGLSINVAQLPLDEQKSLQAIRMEIGEKERHILTIQEQLQKIEHEFARLEKQQKNAKAELQKEEFQQIQLEKNLQQAKIDFEQLNLSAQKDKNQRIAQFEQQLQSVKSLIQTHEQKIRETKQEQHRAKQSLEREKQTRLQQLKDILTIEKQRIENELTALELQHQQNVAQATAQRDKAVEEKGYDRSDLTQLEIDIAKLDQQIDQANYGERRVQQYENFLAEEYEQITTLRQQKQEASQTQQREKLHYEQQQDLAMTQHAQRQSEIDNLKDTLTQYQKELERIQKSMNIAEQRVDYKLFKRLNFDITVQRQPSPSEPNNSDWYLNVKQLREQLEREIQDVKATTHQGIALVNTIKNPFSQQGFSAEVLNETYTVMTGETNWYIQGQALQDYMDNEHDHRKQLIIQNYKTQAERVHNFKSDIDQIHLALNSFTSQINRSCKSICQDLTHLAIEEFSMAIHSSIRDNEWYPILDEFSKHYQNWDNRQLTQKSLPDETLLSSLENVQNYIGQNHLTVEFTRQFSIDLIVKQYGEKPQVAKGSQSFRELSSNGTIRIAQLIIYLSLLKMISNCQDVQLKLFIDEIGVLDEQNTNELLQILQKNHISGMCASPEVVHEAVIPLFANNIACRHDKNNVYDFSQIDDVTMLSTHSKLTDYGCFDL